MKTEVFQLLRGFKTHIDIERHCLLALVNSINLRNNIIDLENALIEALTGDLATGVIYMSTFLVDNR